MPLHKLLKAMNEKKTTSRKLTDEQIAKAKKLLKGNTLREVAMKFGVHPGTILYWTKDEYRQRRRDYQRKKARDKREIVKLYWKNKFSKY